MQTVVDFISNYPVLLPICIFLARVTDVSLGTFRTICVVRGQRLLAAFIGFFEVLVWLGAISTVVARLSNPINVVAYAGGFATGNWVGMWIESKVAIGLQVVRLISREDSMMAERLREAGYVVTEIRGRGRDAPVNVCFVAAYRRDVPAILAKAQEIDGCMLSTIEDVRQTNFLPHHYAQRKAAGWRSILKMK